MIDINGCMQDNSTIEGRKIIEVENYTFILQKVEKYSKILTRQPSYVHYQ